MQCLHNTCIVYGGDDALVSKEFIKIHEVGTHFSFCCIKNALDYSPHYNKGAFSHIVNALSWW